MLTPPAQPSAAPAVPAAPRVREVGVGRPWHWLALGWRDLWACPLPGLLHGLATALFGALLLTYAHRDFWWLAGAFSGFLLVAPVVATGLYAVSRELQAGGRPGMHTVLAAWKPNDVRLVRFGLLLALAGTGWVLTSAALITWFVPGKIREPLDFLRQVALGDSWLFEAWMVLGGVMTAPVFASSVVSIPLMLDTPTKLWVAVLTSWRVVLANPVPMAIWAGLLLALSLLGMLTATLGLVIVVPWLSHASWHAYQDLVEPRTEPHAQSRMDPGVRPSGSRPERR